MNYDIIAYDEKSKKKKLSNKKNLVRGKESFDLQL